MTYNEVMVFMEFGMNST